MCEATLQQTGLQELASVSSRLATAQSSLCHQTSPRQLLALQTSWHLLEQLGSGGSATTDVTGLWPQGSFLATSIRPQPSRATSKPHSPRSIAQADLGADAHSPDQPLMTLTVRRVGRSVASPREQQSAPPSSAAPAVAPVAVQHVQPDWLKPVPGPRVGARPKPRVAQAAQGQKAIASSSLEVPSAAVQPRGLAQASPATSASPGPAASCKAPASSAGQHARGHKAVASISLEVYSAKQVNAPVLQRPPRAFDVLLRQRPKTTADPDLRVDGRNTRGPAALSRGDAPAASVVQHPQAAGQHALQSQRTGPMQRQAHVHAADRADDPAVCTASPSSAATTSRCIQPRCARTAAGQHTQPPYTPRSCPAAEQRNEARVVEEQVARFGHPDHVALPQQKQKLSSSSGAAAGSASGAAPGSHGPAHHAQAAEHPCGHRVQHGVRAAPCRVAACFEAASEGAKHVSGRDLCAWERRNAPLHLPVAPSVSLGVAGTRAGLQHSTEQDAAATLGPCHVPTSAASTSLASTTAAMAIDPQHSAAVPQDVHQQEVQEQPHSEWLDAVGLFQQHRQRVHRQSVEQHAMEQPRALPMSALLRSAMKGPPAASQSSHQVALRAHTASSPKQPLKRRPGALPVTFAAQDQASNAQQQARHCESDLAVCMPGASAAPGSHAACADRGLARRKVGSSGRQPSHGQELLLAHVLRDRVGQVGDCVHVNA
jgi:hypothetical protein